MTAGSTCAITYGAYTVGGLSGTAQLDGPWSYVDGPESAAVSFRAAVYHTTFATLAANAATFISAFRQTRKNLSIAALGNTLLSLSQSSNTGFDSEPEVTLVEDWGYCRVYDVRIVFGRPADYSNLDGRRTSTITVDFSDSRRKTVNISGIYTALNSNDATAVYTSNIDTYTSAVLTVLGGDYNLVYENQKYVETDKILQFERQYVQRFFDNAAATIFSQELTISGSYEYPGDADTIAGETPYRLATWVASYDAGIDSASVTGSALVPLWSGTILPWIINQVAAYSGQAVYVIGSDPHIDASGTRITATVTLRGLVASGPVEWAVSDRIVIDDGYSLRPLLDEDPLSKYIYVGPADVKRIIREGGVWAGSRPDSQPSRTVLEHVGTNSVVYVRNSNRLVNWIPQPWSETINPVKTGAHNTGRLRQWQVQREYSFVGATNVDPLS